MRLCSFQLTPFQNCGLIITLILATLTMAAAIPQYYNYYPYAYGSTSYGGYYNPYSYYSNGQYPYNDYSYLYNLYNAYRYTGYPTSYGYMNGLVFSGK